MKCMTAAGLMARLDEICILEAQHILCRTAASCLFDICGTEDLFFRKSDEQRAGNRAVGPWLLVALACLKISRAAFEGDWVDDLCEWTDIFNNTCGAFLENPPVYFDLSVICAIERVVLTVWDWNCLPAIHYCLPSIQRGFSTLFRQLGHDYCSPTAARELVCLVAGLDRLDSTISDFEGRIWMATAAFNDLLAFLMSAMKALFYQMPEKETEKPRTPNPPAVQKIPTNVIDQAVARKLEKEFEKAPGKIPWASQLPVSSCCYAPKRLVSVTAAITTVAVVAPASEPNKKTRV